MRDHKILSASKPLAIPLFSEDALNSSSKHSGYQQDFLFAELSTNGDVM
jgi:hypothetical protein